MQQKVKSGFFFSALESLFIWQKYKEKIFSAFTDQVQCTVQYLQTTQTVFSKKGGKVSI